MVCDVFIIVIAHSKQLANKVCAMRKRRGFTLVELVVVVLVLGIIAAIAAPKMFDTANDARDSSAMQSLSIIRDAIELYRASNGAYPGEVGTQADFFADMTLFLRGPFPECPVGKKNDNVRVQTTGAPLLANSSSHAWAYDNQIGDFIINHADYDNL